MLSCSMAEVQPVSRSWVSSFVVFFTHIHDAHGILLVLLKKAEGEKKALHLFISNRSMTIKL